MRKRNKYNDIPFTLSECYKCGMELPAYQHLCPPCAEILREEDLYKLQERLCYQYLPKYRDSKK